MSIRILSLARGAVLAGAIGAVLMAVAPASANAATTSTTGATGGCGVAAQVMSQWGTGANVQVTVLNTAAVPSSRWTVTWTLPATQRVVSGWGAVIMSTPVVSDTTVTATNLPYNGTLAPGASTSFGVQLAGTGPVPVMSCASDAVAAVTLTESDNLTSITVHVGQTIAVQIGADYRPLTVGGTAVQQLSTAGGYPTGQPLLATLSAVAPGAADLTTVTDYACLHTVPRCARPQMLWTVHVDVVS